MPIKSPQKQPKKSLRRSKTPPRFPYDVPRRPKTPPRRSQERPRGLQDLSKTPPRRPKRLPRRFRDGPRRILPPFWEPTWGQVGAMLATFPAQDASMTPPRRSQERPKIQYNLGSQPKPGYPISPGDLGWIFYRFLLHFWTIFGGFLVPFLIDFYPKPPPRSARRRNLRVKW